MTSKAYTTEKINKELKEVLLGIEKSMGLTAKNVVKVAENPKHFLHKYFEWDNTIAGQKWREQEARMLINYVIEPAVDGKNNTFSFEFVDNEYKHIDEILTNKDWKEQIADKAIGNLIYWKGKYEKFKIREIHPVIKEIEKLELNRRKNENPKARARNTKARS